MDAVKGLGSGNVNLESLCVLCNHYNVTEGIFYLKLKKCLSILRNDPILPLLASRNSQKLSLEELFDKANQDETPESIAQLLYAVTHAELESTFHKINVHAAMTPSEISRLLEPAFNQAKRLQIAHRLREEKRKGKGSFR